MTRSDTIKVRLTRKYCDGASYRFESKSNKRDIRWDETLPDFGLRLYPSGSKAYIIGYRMPGCPYRIKTVSAYGVESLADARTRAKIELTEVVKGNDPLEQKRQDADSDSVEGFAKSYMKRHALKRKKSAGDDQLLIDKIIVPAIGKRKLKSIKRSDVSRLHQKVGDTINEKTGKPKIYQANRMLALLSRMFTLAELWGAVPEGTPNPCRGIEKFPEEKRDRFVSHEEMPALAKAIDAEKSPILRDCLWLYLLTGLRKAELLSLRWSDVDLDRAEIRLTDTKAGRPHYLPLSSPAVELLRNQLRVQGNPFVFPGRREGQHLVNIDKAWRRARKLAGIDDVRLHDLRRSVGSWLAQSGNSLHLIGKVLNHSNVSTTAVYARFGEDSVRQALEQHGQQLLGVSGKKKSAEVVKIAK